MHSNKFKLLFISLGLASLRNEIILEPLAFVTLYCTAMRHQGCTGLRGWGGSALRGGEGSYRGLGVDGGGAMLEGVGAVSFRGGRGWARPRPPDRLDGTRPRLEREREHQSGNVKRGKTED